MNVLYDMLKTDKERRNITIDERIGIMNFLKGLADKTGAPDSAKVKIEEFVPLIPETMEQLKKDLPVLEYRLINEQNSYPIYNIQNMNPIYSRRYYINRNNDYAYYRTWGEDERV